MGAIVSAIFFCVFCAIHATGADVYAKDANTGVVSFTGAAVFVVYATDAIVSVIYTTDAEVGVIYVTNAVVSVIYDTKGVIYAIHVKGGFVYIIQVTDGSAYATGAVIFATGLFFFVSTSSMGDVSAIPAIARKRKFGSHRHQCKRGEKRNKISNAAPIRNSSAKKTP